MTHVKSTGSSTGPGELWGVGVAVASVIAMAVVILAAGLVRYIPGLPGPDVSAADWVIGYGLLFAAAAFVSQRWGTGSWKADFGLSIRPGDIVWAVCGLFVVLVLANAIGKLAVNVTGTVPPTNARFGGEGHATIFVNGFIGAVLVAPLCEEILFRGIVLRGLLQSFRGRRPHRDRVAWARTGAVVVSAVLFAGLHTYQAFGSESELISLGLTALAVGLVNGILVVTTHRLGAGIIIHMSLNALSLSALVHLG